MSVGWGGGGWGWVGRVSMGMMYYKCYPLLSLMFLHFMFVPVPLIFS